MAAYGSQTPPDVRVQTNMSDTPSHVEFSPAAADVFAATSWDGGLRAFQLARAQNSAAQVVECPHAAPALSFAWVQSTPSPL